MQQQCNLLGYEAISPAETPASTECFNMSHCKHIRPVLLFLHCPPTEYLIQCGVSVPIFKALSDLSPIYLKDYLTFWDECYGEQIQNRTLYNKGKAPHGPSQTVEQTPRGMKYHYKHLHLTLQVQSILLPPSSHK